MNKRCLRKENKMTKKKRVFVFLSLCFCLALTNPAFASGPEVFKKRREKLASMVKEGIVIVQSTQRNQNNLLEHFGPNLDNHDFIFLTGLETSDSTLVICPKSEQFPEILYIKGDPEKLRERTGIEHIFPPEKLLHDISNAYTDFSLLRYTQRIWKPLPTEISRILYNNSGKKVIYFNFPRFVNLNEPPPKRLEFIKRIEYFSPKYEIRDISDFLDTLRMYHDDYGIQQLRRATRISGEAMIECMKSAVPGMSKDQLRAVFNFVCRFKGATGFGFGASVMTEPKLPMKNSPPPTETFEDGQLINIDAGAEFNHYTADIQRTFPVSGKFTDRQKKLYDIVKKAHLACIQMVRPGITMKDLQETAQRILDDEGGYGQYYKWGTSHFLGMECHDHGNNLIPFKPGVVIAVEPGIVLPEFNICLEDDVLCTEDGYDWLTGFIPIDTEDIEKIMKEKGIGEIFLKAKN